MTDELTISPQGVAPQSPSVKVATETSESTSATTSLRGQIQSGSVAAHPFHSSLNEPPAQSASESNTEDWRVPGDFIDCPTAHAEKYFTYFTEARKFARDPANGGRSPEETIANARFNRSAASVLSKENAKTQGMAETSVYARMQKALLDPDYQKTFFGEFTGRAGYEADLAAIDDEALFENWQRLQTGKITEKEFFEPLNKLPKKQRIAFALNLARVIASRCTEENLFFEDESVASLNLEITKTESALENAPSASGTQKTLNAELENMQNLYAAKTSILTPDGIDNGRNVLETLLALPPDDAPDRPSARLSWNPCESWKEVDDVISLFEDCCVAYNMQTASRTDELRKERVFMKDSALPLLGMPLELRGGKLAEKVRTAATQDYLEQNGLSEPKTFGEHALRAAKVCGIAVLTAITCGLVWSSAGFREVVLPIFSREKRERMAQEHADERQLSVLRNQNRKLAKDWVVSQHDISSGGNNLPSLDVINDPHGLFAAIANPLLQNTENDFLAHERLVEDVSGQLYLAAKRDILVAKEHLADLLQVPLSDPRVFIENEDYLTDAAYLNDMARSIVNGIAEGLHWSMQQQQDRRNAQEVSGSGMSEANAYTT